MGVRQTHMHMCTHTQMHAHMHTHFPVGQWLPCHMGVKHTHAHIHAHTHHCPYGGTWMLATETSFHAGGLTTWEHWWAGHKPEGTEVPTPPGCPSSTTGPAPQPPVVPPPRFHAPIPLQRAPRPPLWPPQPIPNQQPNTPETGFQSPAQPLLCV